VSTRLLAAGRARQEGRTEDVLRLLQEEVASQSADGNALPVWRLAKAAYDFDRPATLAGAVRALIRLQHPFEGYPARRAAAPLIAARLWDTEGYQSHTLELMVMLERAHASVGDGYLAALAVVHQAWHLACTGQLDTLNALATRYSSMTPRVFGRGPTKHPEAEDSSLSLYWIQADLARTQLRANTWGGLEVEAKQAATGYERAMAMAGRDRWRNFWYVDPVCRAADQFGWATPAFASWSRLLPAVESAHATHHDLASGVLARRRGNDRLALASFEAAAQRATTDMAGFEWRVDALTMAATVNGADTYALMAEARATATMAGIRHHDLAG